MSRQKLEAVKSAKWFKGWDVFIYALIAALLLALFLAFVFLPEREALAGVEIMIKNEHVFFCDFEEGNFEVLDAERVRVEEADGLLVVTVTAEGGYNVVGIDMTARRAEMTDADCSWSRDCVHMPAIEDTASAPISCVPHGVVVMPVGGELTSDGTLH